ncbi:MAG TPA: rRNA maturation RNase YbeY [Stackebrandtia sp.]|uniref:rRNA maturation RNase YbeY n=1 Tax=Stackebrandtia sp. TaxID=2023065 RepID=UPI002D293F6A|nr:rRNA maturation RNase YbeY [Stackebrandtia sp.]HZE38553.1 rRNA maturation RNase YbeY [Stackebrandtia sp.]
MTIEIANESGATVDTAAICDVARHALSEMGVNPLADLSILVVDSGYMAELNHRWMGSQGPTDVLAFPMDELSVGRGPSNDEEPVAETLLGDVVLCPEVAERQATAAGHSAADELHMLTVHGVLHILGYDHAEPDEAKKMFGLQKSLLDGWRRERTP